MKKTGIIDSEGVSLEVFINEKNTPVLSVYLDETEMYFSQIYHFEDIEDIDHLIKLLKQVKKEYNQLKEIIAQSENYAI